MDYWFLDVSYMYKFNQDVESNRFLEFLSLSFSLSLSLSLVIFLYPYLPTPPLGKDMTQGQFLSEV